MIKKILAGALLATVAISAIAPVASAASGKNIVERTQQINRYTHQFDTLLTAATCPQFKGAVVDVLLQDGITVFAPTDRAFRRLGRQLGLGRRGLNPSNVCDVDKVLDSPGALLRILAYHVYDRGAVDYRTALSLRGNAITMASGDEAKLSGRWWRLRVDGQRVILPNVRASNGIIHVTRGVLNPLS